MGIKGLVFARYLRGIGLVAREQDGLLQYYLFNARGDVVQRTDYAGTTLKNYEYDAFGVEQQPEDLDSNPFRYCGEYFDREAQTLYLRNRMYSAGNGRFTQEDPIRSGMNWYAYCGGNPVRYIDPLGLRASNTDPDLGTWGRQPDGSLGWSNTWTDNSNNSAPGLGTWGRMPDGSLGWSGTWVDNSNNSRPGEICGRQPDGSLGWSRGSGGSSNPAAASTPIIPPPLPAPDPPATPLPPVMGPPSSGPNSSGSSLPTFWDPKTTPVNPNIGTQWYNGNSSGSSQGHHAAHFLGSSNISSRNRGEEAVGGFIQTVLGLGLVAGGVAVIGLGATVAAGPVIVGVAVVMGIAAVIYGVNSAHAGAKRMGNAYR